MMSIADAGYESWIAGMRECTGEDEARSKPLPSGTQAELAKRQPAVSLEGRLVPANADCTLMECGGGCCNQCTVDWVLVPRRPYPGRTLRISLRGTAVSLAGCAMDCAVRGYGQEADWVIVSGQIGGKGDVVLDADLCRLRSATRDELTDAEYERLTRAARPGR